MIHFEFNVVHFGNHCGFIDLWGSLRGYLGICGSPFMFFGVIVSYRWELIWVCESLILMH